MRNCLRCGAEMREGCAVKVEGAGYGVVLSTEENKIFSGRIGRPKVAVCPECGSRYNVMTGGGAPVYGKARSLNYGLTRYQCLRSESGGYMIRD